MVTIDASEHGRSALETAVRLAALLNADLAGVFVEDTNLIKLAELPFLREVRQCSLAEETVSVKRMQRELRALARQAEHMLEQAAHATGVSWSFQVWRGRAGATALADNFSADILSLGRTRALSITSSWGTTGLRSRLSGYRPEYIHVLFDDSEQAIRALSTAARLAQDTGTHLLVLLPDMREPEYIKLKASALSLTETNQLTTHIVRLRNPGLQTLTRAVGRDKQSLLVAGTNHALLQLLGLDACLDAIPCPLVLVR
jgi:nucleotide-binding universal stress UspA family protein